VPLLATTRPLLCIVTDRRRLAGAADRPLSAACDLLLRQVEGAVSAGICIVQVREPDLDARDLLRLVRGAVEIAAGSGTAIVVNDRLDVAIAAGASGVHLRESSMSAADVRRLAPGMIVGRSVHGEAGVRLAGPVDYLIAGTTFPTASKPGDSHPTIGVEGLERVARAAGKVPVLAIGGMTPAVAADVARTGAAGMAAIAAFFPAGSGDDIMQAVRTSANALRAEFRRAAPHEAV
jgi:thiamine-phosphate diphosphorylase